jgi:dipeptidyl aminopeptidase/acylaminoacyl peptidase
VTLSPMAKHRVTFKSDDGLTLVGYLFVPPGPPGEKHPAIVWNHGSEKDPAPDRQFRGVANAFVPAGYVVFAPERRGQGESQGEYISDTVAAARTAGGKEAAAKKMVELMETSQLGDQLAGLAFLRTQQAVDGDRIVVMGCSYGGIQTILGAESQKSGYRAGVALSPGAESWGGNQPLRQRLTTAMSNMHVPLMLGHPQGDASVEPGYTLGQKLQQLGKPYELVIFPRLGDPATQGHCFGGARGNGIWSADALRFLDSVIGLHPHPDEQPHPIEKPVATQPG